MVRKRFRMVPLLVTITTTAVVAVLFDRANSEAELASCRFPVTEPTSALYGYPDGEELRRPRPTLDDRMMRVILACSGIEFVPRHVWGARQPKCWDRLKVQPVPRFFVHHTTEAECFDFWSCSRWMSYWQNFHMDTRGWCDLGYSFLIGGDGRVYVARGWDASGAHTKGHNEDALAASFIGDFSRHLPTPRALWALHRLLQCGVALGKISRYYTLHGHRDAGCTSCPGDALYAYISRWNNFGGRLQKYICEPLGRTNRSVPH